MSAVKYFLFIFLFLTSVYAETKKVYFYTTEKSINDFKSLKVNFDEYLQKFGAYDFQAFSTRDTFEEYLNKKDIIVILSSWHFQKIAQKYNLNPKLVAIKQESNRSTKVLVGKKGSEYNGTVTTAFSSEYSQKIMNEFSNNLDLKLLNVPKEIDALMSVGFGMSKFALVSKDSLDLLQQANTFLASQIEIYEESLPDFRILIAFKSQEKEKQKLIDMFTSMSKKREGKKILDLLRVDNLVVLTQNELRQLGGSK